MIEMSNNPIIKPMIQQIITDISNNGISYDVCYNYIVLGVNDINPDKAYSYGDDITDIRSFIEPSVRTYNQLTHTDAEKYPEDYNYFLCKIKHNLKYDMYENDKIEYNNFIDSCVSQLK